jgi:hypothetical protein
MGFQAWLGVGSLLGLLAASMLIAIVVVVSLKADERHLNDRDVPYASAVAVAALNAKGIANDQRGYLLTGDAWFIHEADRRISDARAAFAAAATAAVDPAQRQAVNDAHAGFERWVQAMRGEFATFPGRGSSKRDRGVARRGSGAAQGLRTVAGQGADAGRELDPVGHKYDCGRVVTVGVDSGRLAPGRARDRRCGRVLAGALHRDPGRPLTAILGADLPS